MDLFSPLSLGDLELPNRLVMAPLTRLRSGETGVPNALNAEYYAQRAGLGLIISEGTYPSRESRSYPGQPGIVDDEQQAGWARVVDAVHAAGGRIALQLMNGGRVSHPDITGTERIVAPSAVAIDGEVRTPAGKKPFPVPHALTARELADVRDEFVAAARRAVDAGADAVELHSANGYLLHQFLAPDSNRRDDDRGGSPAGRIRFVVEVAEAVADAVGAGRVGIRVSPAHGVQGLAEADADDVRETYGLLMDALAPLGLAFASVLHADPRGELVQELRRRFGGVWLANDGFGVVTTRESAVETIDGGWADAVVVGRPVIANPDLVERWRRGAELNEPDPSTFYTPGPAGYTDYPALAG